MKKRPNILTIAGFDPTSGAGLSADLKTFEVHQCYGMAVQTANTLQTGEVFRSVNWVKEELILEQLSLLLDRYHVDAVKVGLIPSFDFLIEALRKVEQKNGTCLIVWDPVLSTSSNFDFQHEQKELFNVLDRVDWLTPNWNECKRLSANQNAVEGARILGSKTNVLLKGGHNEAAIGMDFLFAKGSETHFKPKVGIYSEKHGSGCVFASALTANLVLGYPQAKAVLRAKRYVERFLKSDSSLLGFHKR